ncbi:MAG: hypothetical protein II887_01755 [Bacteroidales bacterium]|nr:hypothetical protein [Bacteroidales bacterium]
MSKLYLKKRPPLPGGGAEVLAHEVGGAKANEQQGTAAEGSLDIIEIL